MLIKNRLRHIYVVRCNLEWKITACFELSYVKECVCTELFEM